MSNYNRQHAADFAEWRIRHPHEVVNTPEEAGITSTLKVGDKVTLKVDKENRALAENNHSATYSWQSVCVSRL